MTISEYRKKNSVIVESGGMRFKVRAPGVAEYAMAGDIPDAMSSIAQRKELTDAQRKSAADWNARFQKIVLTQCVTIIDADGNPTKEVIVDKIPSDCGTNEISYRELAVTDATLLTSSAAQQSIVSKEAAQAAKTFPLEQAPVIELRHDSPPLPQAAD